ncbi:hypothetical protein D3C75_231720 [compost metagenome]
MADRLRRRRVGRHVVDQHAGIDAAGGIARRAVLDQGTLQGNKKSCAVGRQAHAFHALVVAAPGLRRGQRSKGRLAITLWPDRQRRHDHALQPALCIEVVDVGGVLVADVEVAVGCELQRFGIECDLAGPRAHRGRGQHHAPLVDRVITRICTGEGLAVVVLQHQALVGRHRHHAEALRLVRGPVDAQFHALQAAGVVVEQAGLRIVAAAVGQRPQHPLVATRGAPPRARLYRQRRERAQRIAEEVHGACRQSPGGDQSLVHVGEAAHVHRAWWHAVGFVRCVVAADRERGQQQGSSGHRWTPRPAIRSGRRWYRTPGAVPTHGTHTACPTGRWARTRSNPDCWRSACHPGW